MPKDSRPPAFLLYVDDFAADGKVEAMTTQEVGAYILLLCKSWREDPPGSIPDDDRVLARWARLTPGQWSECRTGVLAAFTLGTDTRWHQKRLRSEFAKLKASMIAKSRAGEAGAKSRWKHDINGTAIADACGSQCDRNANTSSSSIPIQYSLSENKEPPKSPKGESAEILDCQVAEIYQAYPLKQAKGQALKAIRGALKKVTFEELLEATKAYAAARRLKTGKVAEYTPHPATWFNGERWNDDRTLWKPKDLSNGKQRPAIAEVNRETGRESKYDAPDAGTGW